MLSRIAKGLYEVGREIERAQHVIRILEVNHKMNLERATSDEGEIWATISNAFGCGLERPDERQIYEVLVLSATHPDSVRRCITSARHRCRAMREHLSEEVWLHLNRTHLELDRVEFESILETGRSEFNRQIEIATAAFHGLADDTMLQRDAWTFLKIGKWAERSSMICRILDIKRQSVAPQNDGAPLAVHQWQALLRSLSGYEPYRRAHDARIIPGRVLEFVLKRPEFPRSLAYSLSELRAALESVSGPHPLQIDVDLQMAQLLEALHSIRGEDLCASGRWESFLDTTDAALREVIDSLEFAYFTSLRPASISITPLAGVGLVG